MRIKGLLGFCECKGCRSRAEYDMDIIIESDGVRKKIKTVKICGKHAADQLRGAKLKSITV